MMEYWVDGYNLLLRQGWTEGRTLEQARERLVQTASRVGKPVRLYFDATKLPPSTSSGEPVRGRVRTIFVRHATADDAIVNDLRSSGETRSVRVVTDDRELRGRARQLGAETLGVKKFLTRLERGAAPKPPAAGRRDVEDWLDYFGIDENWTPEND